MVVEASVLVICDDQHGLLPERTRDERLHNSGNESLALTNVSRHVVVVAPWRFDVVWLDERDARQRAVVRGLQELAETPDLVEFECISSVEAQEAVVVFVQ